MTVDSSTLSQSLERLSLLHGPGARTTVHLKMFFCTDDQKWLWGCTFKPNAFSERGYITGYDIDPEEAVRKCFEAAQKYVSHEASTKEISVLEDIRIAEQRLNGLKNELDQVRSRREFVSDLPR